MENGKTVETESVANLIQVTEEIVKQVTQYSDVVINSVLVLIVGVFAIYLIHKVSAKFLFPHLGKGRIVKVAGVSLYALILVAAALTILSGVGIDVSVIGKVALVTIFVAAVLLFLLLPFLPKLPYQIGHLIEIKGELGMVSAVSPLFTTLNRLDGTLVFVLNTSITSNPIKNYSHIPVRRVELNLSVKADSDLVRTKQTLVKIMSEDERVLEKPQRSAVFVNKANAHCIDLLAVCWVKNEDWFDTQSDLWENIVNAFNEDIHLA